MTTVTVTLRPIGRGGWGPVTLIYDPRVRSELPAPMEFRRGQRVPMFGREYRVARVTQTETPTKLRADLLERVLAPDHRTLRVTA